MFAFDESSLSYESSFTRGVVSVSLMAIMNGGLRNAVLTPRLGELGGHITSTVLLCAAILVVTWLTIDWIRPANLDRGATDWGWVGLDDRRL